MSRDDVKKQNHPYADVYTNVHFSGMHRRVTRRKFTYYGESSFFIIDKIKDNHTFVKTGGKK